MTKFFAKGAGSPAAVGVALLLTASPAWGEGHGPVFALSTPTQGKGDLGSDTSFMILDTTQGTTSMFGQVFSYGLTEDWELDLGIASPMINRLDPMPRTRPGSMMESMGDELTLQTRYRFHKEFPGVGERRESTAFIGTNIPYRSRIRGMKRAPSLNVGAATGYASREWYWWVGGGYQRYFERDGDRLGDLPYLTGALGWRPPAFAWDYPEQDWRVFLEGVAEFPQRNRIDGSKVRDSGGERFMLGPSVLGLFGPWGVSGGVLFPVHQNLHGDQPRENLRARFIVTFWF